MTSEIIYKGLLRTEATHLQSSSTIETDAPTDNQGKGERFSPTDLVATALGSCMLTIMGIKARDMGVDLEGTQVAITKHMAADPRRISAIDVAFTVNPSIVADAKQRVILERAAETCPVAKSLHPDLDVRIQWHWPAL